MNSMTKFLSIGDLSKTTGCNIETIRYYEKIGLLFEPDRSSGGHRLYDRSASNRLRFILRSRELGFPISEIRTLLGLVDEKSLTCGEVKDLTEGHIRNIKKKIKDLRKLETVLNKMVAECEGGNIPDCPIIDALSSIPDRPD